MRKILIFISLFLLVPGFIYSQGTRKVETDTLKARAALKIKGTDRTSLFDNLNLSSEITSVSIADSAILLQDLSPTVNILAGGAGTYAPDDASLEFNISGSDTTIKIKSLNSKLVVADTTALKLVTATADGETRYMTSLSGSNSLGGGWFVRADSSYPEGGLAFDAPTAGKQWIRIEWLNHWRAPEWFGAVGDSATLDSLAWAKMALIGSGKIICRTDAKYRFGKVGTWFLAHDVHLDLNGSIIYYNTQDTTGNHFTAGLFDLSALNWGGNTTITDHNLFWRNGIIENGSIISNGDSAGVVGDPAYYDTLNASPVAYDRRRNVQVNSGTAIHAHSTRNLIVRNMYFRWVGRAIDVENRITSPIDLDVAQVHFEKSTVLDWGSVAVIAPSFSEISAVTFDNSAAPSLSQADISADKGSSHGIYFTGSKIANTVENCTFIGVRTHAVQWFSGGDGGAENTLNNNKFIDCHKPFTVSGSNSKNFERIIISNNVIRNSGTFDMSGPNKYELLLMGNHWTGRDPHGNGVDTVAPNEPHVSISAGSIVINGDIFYNSGDDGSASSILINTATDIKSIEIKNSTFSDSLNSTKGTVSIKWLTGAQYTQTPVTIGPGNVFEHKQALLAAAVDSVFQNVNIFGNIFNTTASQLTCQIPAGFKATNNLFNMTLNNSAFFINGNGGGKPTYIDRNDFIGNGTDTYVAVNSVANADARSIYFRGNTVTTPFTFNVGTTLARKSYESTANFVVDHILVDSTFVYQPTADIVTGFQVLDADGGTPILNIDTINERIGVNTAAPTKQFELIPTSNDNGIFMQTDGGRKSVEFFIGSTINGNFYMNMYQGANVLNHRFDSELNLDSYINGPGTGTGGFSIGNTTTGAWLGIHGNADGNNVAEFIADKNDAVGDSSIVVTAVGDLVPGADGTQDLGTQTTAQWANVWADLINGGDHTFLNDWRLLESDKFKGYPKGIAIGNKKRNKFKSGVVTKRAKGKPIFAITEEFIEFKGIRITLKEWRNLAKIAKVRK